jgi:DNA-directed RNA polymerase subunit RPC12/RpoP
MHSVYREKSKIKAVGVACSKCGKELKFAHPDRVCASIPPKMEVTCECGFRGYMVV